MKCKEAHKLLSAFHDGELAPLQERKVQEHVKQCTHCQHELRQLGELSQAFQSYKDSLQFSQEQLKIQALLRSLPQKQQPRKWYEAISIWFNSHLLPPKRRFAIAALSVASLLIAMASIFIMSGNEPETAKIDYPLTPSMVESIEYGGESVIIMQNHQTNSTIIWLQSQSDEVIQEDGSM